MAKKTKRQFNVRLKEETVFQIEVLATKWECSQAEVVERLVGGVQAGGLSHVPGERVVPDPAVDRDMDWGA